MKILHAPVNIANQAWLLAKGQRLLGHDARVYVNRESAFGFPYDKLVDFNSGTRQERLTRIFGHFAECLEEDFDVFHFYYSASLLPRSYGIAPFTDLPILKGLGKKIFFHLIGCDFRIPALSYHRNHDSMCVSCRGCLDIDKTLTLEPILERSSGIIIGGKQGEAFIGGASAQILPLAVDLEQLGESAPQREVPRIIHMPSSRKIKGTEFVLTAVETLRKKGLQFDFELIEGRSHEEALKSIEDADVVIDQLGSDFYGTAAIEAMARGKVVVTSVLDEFSGQYGEKAPVVKADPRTLAGVLETWIPDASRRNELGRRAYRYAAKHHDYRAVARKSIEIYEKPVAPVPKGRTARKIVLKLREETEEKQKAFEMTAPQSGAVFPEKEQANPASERPFFERFNQGLEEYVKDKFLLGREYYAKQLKRLEVKAAGAVLDLGCGPGQWALTLAENYPANPVYACDRNDFLLSSGKRARAEVGAPNLRWVRANVQMLPFPDGSFDTVLCLGVLQLVRPLDTLKEVFRVMKKGGRLHLLVSGAGFYARNCFQALAHQDAKTFKANYKFLANTWSGKENVPFSHFSAKKLSAFARQLGFEAEYLRPSPIYPPQKETFLGLPVTLETLWIKK